MTTSRLIAYSTAHFAVDFSCAFLLFALAGCGILSNENVVAAFIAYNILAFGTEFVVGLFFNAKTARRCAEIGILGVFAALSCAFLAVVFREPGDEASLFLTILTTTAIVLAGTGNSFFHVGGGIDVLSFCLDKKNKYWRGGVFLSTGALGLALGTLFANACVGDGDFILFDAFSFAAVAIFLTLCGGLVGRRRVSERRDAGAPTLPLESLEKRRSETGRAPSHKTIWPIVCVLLATSAIFVRSFGGFFATSIASNTIPFGTAAAIALAVAASLGKAFGGVLADRFGGAAVGLSATFAAIPALCWNADALSLLFFLGVALLNVSTAITLVSTAENCGGRLGLAFGLTTLALLCGYFGFDVADQYFVENDWSGARNIFAIALGVAAVFVSVSTVYHREKWEKR